jgi:hypothetical protein
MALNAEISHIYFPQPTPGGESEARGAKPGEKSIGKFHAVITAP